MDKTCKDIKAFIDNRGVVTTNMIINEFCMTDKAEDRQDISDKIATLIRKGAIKWDPYQQSGLLSSVEHSWH